MKLLALIKKEFHRFFHDPRLIVTVVLPGIIIFALYSLLGSIIYQDEVRQYRFAVTGESVVIDMIRSSVEESGSELHLIEINSAEEGQALVLEGKADLYLKLPEDFDLSLAGFSAGQVEIWYDASNENSLNLYQITSSVLQAVGMKFSVLPHSISNAEGIGRMIIADMLPFLVVTLIFSACMSVTLESIAGEKERGTLATILATSVPRAQIALGKILPLSAIAAIGATSSFLGVIFSLPKLMGTSLSALGGYGFLSYILLLILILSIVPLIVGAISAVSTFSKSVKEASAYTSVIMILIMVLSLTSSFLDLGAWAVGVPVLNAVYVMGLILRGSAAVWQTLLAVGVNLAVTALLVFIVSKMLSSERVMFGK